MAGYEGWFAPVPWSDHTATRSALVIMTDPRAAVATTLVLQEMGLSVDLGSEPVYALRWLRQAHYDLVVAGGPGADDSGYVTLLRAVAPDSRLVILPSREVPGTDPLPDDVEVLGPPVDVNRLVECFAPPEA